MDINLMQKPEVIRSIIDGTTLLVSLNKGDSIGAWRVRASELNSADGWSHYSVKLNEYTGQVAITAHKKEEKE